MIKAYFNHAEIKNYIGIGVRRRKGILLFLLVMILLSVTACSDTLFSEQPQADAGTISLSHWDFDDSGPIVLDGQWEFYWNRFLFYEDFQSGELTLSGQETNPDFYADVPNLWNQYILDNKNLSGLGYATYRLHVVTDLPAGTRLGIRPNTFSSASRIYINDVLVEETGAISSDPSLEIPKLQPKVAFFDAPGGEFDIIVQVSNYHYARGGFWYSMPFGLATDILELHTMLIGQELFLLGALFIIFIFNVSIFLTQKELKHSLYFAGACIAMGINYDLVSGQTLLTTLLPSISYDEVIYLWYATSDWMLLLMLFYFHELFRSRTSAIVSRVVLAAIIPLEVLYLITEPVFYSKTAIVGNGVQYLALACILLIIALGIRNGSRDGWFSLISLFLLGATSTLDGLQWSGTIQTGLGDILYLGILLFLILHVILQAIRIRQFHDRKNAAELAFLQAQIKPHFLFNALNTFSAISLTDNRKAQKLISDLSIYLRRSFDFKEIRQMVPIKKELELLEAYLEIEKARFGDRIQIHTEISVDQNLEIPILLLQPLVENAIVHGILPRQEGGLVEISIHEEDRNLVIQIRDDGIGLADSEIQKILQQSRSDGVGLYNIQERLKRLYGTGLAIESKLGSGTLVTISIPLKKKVK